MPPKGKYLLESRKLRNKIHTADPEMGLLYNEATAELSRRKLELIRTLRASAEIIEIKKGSHYEIRLPKSLGGIELEVLENGLLISSLRVGSYNLPGSALKHLGIGSMLVGLAKEFALKKGYKRLHLFSSWPAEDFYKKLGFSQEEKSMYFFMDL